jgi:tRNA1Val (adenine37-N6)-methyltransferase
MIHLKDDETLDDLLLGDLKIIQARDGYRFSIDPVLLCAFADVTQDDRVVDLGTGCGVIPLILIQTGKGAEIVGLERQPAMVARAKQSVALNGLDGRIEIRPVDVRELPDDLPSCSFDVAFCNPPYRAHGSGRKAPNEERAAARHEVAGGLTDFLQAGRFLVKPGGLFFMVYLAERLTELLFEMRMAKLEPKRLRLVHPRVGEQARLVLVEGRKDGRPGLKVEPPLNIYDGPGRSYTPEVQEMY